MKTEAEFKELAIETGNAMLKRECDGEMPATIQVLAESLAIVSVRNKLSIADTCLLCVKVTTMLTDAE